MLKVVDVGLTELPLPPQAIATVKQTPVPNLAKNPALLADAEETLFSRVVSTILY